MDYKITKELLSDYCLPRENTSHKGDYGHALLICGCDSMPGAASLTTGAALKSGCGLVTLHSSAYACQISAVANPSAILSIDDSPCFSQVEFNLSKYNAVGVGPGLGKDSQSKVALEELMESCYEADVPMVLDADALNIIAENRWIDEIPKGFVLTPHDGELARLISWSNEEDKVRQTQKLADETQSVVISKGYHTKVFIPDEQFPYENTTGNPGMAKGGSGDVLTGLITGLLARGYKLDIAAKMGVWIHGYAGDCCSQKFGMEAYSSKDLIDHLWMGFKALGSNGAASSSGFQSPRMQCGCGNYVPLG